MIVTVTPNPALDLTWHVEKIVPGDTHRADTGQARAGGKGLNVARVAHAQGADAVAVATVGGATGEEFAAELRDSGLPHQLVPVAIPTRRSIALVDEHLGDTTIVNERGQAPASSEWQSLHDAVRSRMRNGREKPEKATKIHTGTGQTVLVIAGSMPPGAPDDGVETLMAVGKDAGAVVIVDTSGPAMLRAADAGADVLKPNAAELVTATGLDDPIEGAQELLRRGAGLVLVSLGADGMIAVRNPGWGPARRASDTHTDGVSSGNRDAAPTIVRARLPEALSGNPTGAGDAAVAAVASLLAAGEDDTETLLRRAVAWSAAAVLMPLAGSIHSSWPDLDASVLIRKDTR